VKKMSPPRGGARADAPRGATCVGCTRGSRRTRTPLGRSSRCRRSSAFASTNGNVGPNSCRNVSAVRSCAFAKSTATERRPLRAPDPEIVAVPLPSSIASSRDSNPSKGRTSDSRVPQSLHSSSSVCHALRPAAMWAGAHRSQAGLFRFQEFEPRLSRQLVQLGMDRSPVRAVVELAHPG
jgi:hypothetical protein